MAALPANFRQGARAGVRWSSACRPAGSHRLQPLPALVAPARLHCAPCFICPLASGTSWRGGRGRGRGGGLLGSDCFTRAERLLFFDRAKMLGTAEPRGRSLSVSPSLIPLALGTSRQSSWGEEPLLRGRPLRLLWTGGQDRQTPPPPTSCCAVRMGVHTYNVQPRRACFGTLWFDKSLASRACQQVLLRCQRRGSLSGHRRHHHQPAAGANGRCP